MLLCFVGGGGVRRRDSLSQKWWASFLFWFCLLFCCCCYFGVEEGGRGDLLMLFVWITDCCPCPSACQALILLFSVDSSASKHQSFIIVDVCSWRRPYQTPQQDSTCTPLFSQLQERHTWGRTGNIALGTSVLSACTPFFSLLWERHAWERTGNVAADTSVSPACTPLFSQLWERHAWERTGNTRTGRFFVFVFRNK